MDILGESTLPTTQLLELIKRAQAYEEFRGNVQRSLEHGLLSIIKSMVTTLKAEGISRVDVEVDAPELIEDVLDRGKVLHIYISKGGEFPVIIAKTGEPEKQ